MASQEYNPVKTYCVHGIPLDVMCAGCGPECRQVLPIQSTTSPGPVYPLPAPSPTRAELEALLRKAEHVISKFRTNESLEFDLLQDIGKALS